MAFTITTKTTEKTFQDKKVVNIGTKEEFDIHLNVNFPCVLTIQYDEQTNKCVLLNQFNNPNFLFKGQTLPQSLEIDKASKIMVKDSDEFITIKTIASVHTVTLAQDNLSEDDIKTIYGTNTNAAAKLKIESRKDELEQARIAITKDVAYKINDFKKRISMNTSATIFLHIALMFASLICAFGVSNYLTGLPLEDAQSVIQMPVNLKLILIYMLITFGVGITLKQGMYLYFKNKHEQSNSHSHAALIGASALFYGAIYLINALYYMAPGTMPLFAVLISAFFVGCAAALAISTGYFKFSNIEIQNQLYKYEYRADFEHVVKEYQRWISYFVNCLSKNKIQNIKDRQFTLQIKGFGEIILGILTAPFLAYGVSNTLAMCFPEAAGWIRVSGLRFSPVFLVLASVMIVFAFFAFAAGFTAVKKVQASNVLKRDGFSNYLNHGVEFLGLEATKRLELDMKRSFVIGITIIFIEFSMNVSYFMQEMGGDLGGMFLSGLAALVPTAILIAETYMLSQTSFEISACDDLISKLDKE